ncbi:sigma-70 family RNA polymerase sigma factor [Mucilaginibacter sp.]|uniref:RNA polymerase sigma factor n=1 Tax=Mucilaginibacter sp. TaxID=1882438 RepID=UPI002ED32027
MNNGIELTKWWEQTLVGDVKSFSRIHDTLYSPLYFYLFKIVKDEDAAQDILQDLFIKFWERKERFGPINNVKYYFFKSARSLAINYLKAYRPELLDLQNCKQIDVVFSAEDLLVSMEAGRENRQILAMALNALPKRQKEMIFLRYFDDWNYDQIAEVTGLQYQSVVNHVHRGINQLRLKLTENKRCTPTELVA